MDLVAKEIAYYKAHRLQFIEEYNRKHLLIKGEEIIGVYASKTAAKDAACTLEEGTYIIEHPVKL